MAYVALLLILPVFQMECPGVKVSWSALQLATGSEGSIGGDLADMDGMSQFQWDQATGGELPKDPMLLAIPILAALVILTLLARSSSAANTLMAVLLGFFAYYSVVGFKIERELATGLSQARSQVPGGLDIGGQQMAMAETMLNDAVARTTWWWLGGVAVVVALILLNLPRLVRRT